VTVEPRLKNSIWRWPREWFRDQGFWKDVASRTLAAVIAAAILFIFAVAGGYVGRPSVWPIVLVGSATCSVVLALVMYVRRRNMKLAALRATRAKESIRRQVEGLPPARPSVVAKRPPVSRRPALYLTAALAGSVMVAILSSYKV
jgi:hypothetical protein